jgi:hypothetical protein
MASASTDSVIETVSGSDTKTIEQLIELGNQARKTLGLLPKAVYFDAADKGFLLTVRKEGEPVAYVLFRLPRNEVVLTHVCVEKEHRRSGLAHLLINEVSERYPARLGLRAKCRDDYPNIQDVWRGLGFDRLGPAQGRGNDQAAMTVWWRDHGHPNLFTPVDEPTVLAVAIDVNILMDLHTRSHHPSAERSQVLLAPDVRSRIERTVPGGLERDVERQPAELRGRLVAAASRYRRPHGPPGRAEQLFERLLAGVQAELPNYPRTPQDTGDLWQIAETAAAGIQVFLTWDDRLRNEIAPLVLQIENAPELSRVRVIDPDHLVIHLDELAHAAAYQPRALEGSQFSTELANADSEAVLMTFRDNASGETKQELKERLRALARLTRSHSIIRDEDGTPVGCTASVVDGEILRAPLLRVANHPVAETMARHLLWALRRNARQEGAKIVGLTTPTSRPCSFALPATSPISK